MLELTLLYVERVGSFVIVGVWRPHLNHISKCSPQCIVISICICIYMCMCHVSRMYCVTVAGVCINVLLLVCHGNRCMPITLY